MVNVSGATCILGLYNYGLYWTIALFFFFKQKTAYEMRISDWSSDVCSSDLYRDIPAAGSTQEYQVGEVGDFFALLKPRVMSLVVFTGLAGLLVAPGSLHPILAAVAVLCIAVGSGAAGAINMWYDRDIDAVMERTRDRPIPVGRVEPSDALAFGVILAEIGRAHV